MYGRKWLTTRMRMKIKLKKLSLQNKKNRISDPKGLDPSIPVSERKSRLVSYEHIAKHICYLQYVTTYSLYDFAKVG